MMKHFPPKAAGAGAKARGSQFRAQGIETAALVEKLFAEDMSIQAIAQAAGITKSWTRDILGHLGLLKKREVHKSSEARHKATTPAPQGYADDEGLKFWRDAAAACDEHLHDLQAAFGENGAYPQLDIPEDPGSQRFIGSYALPLTKSIAGACAELGG